MFSVGSDRGPWHQVIGVVTDVKQMGVVEDVRPEAYDAFYGNSRLLLVLHTSRNPQSLTFPVRRAPQVAVDPDPIYIRDGSCYTSAGVTAGIDLCLALLRRLFRRRLQVTPGQYRLSFGHAGVR